MKLKLGIKMIRLVVDHSPGAFAVNVQCYVCGKMEKLADCVIDANGPSFKAYYCPRHVPEATVEPCTRNGCVWPIGKRKRDLE